MDIIVNTIFKDLVCGIGNKSISCKGVQYLFVCDWFKIVITLRECYNIEVFCRIAIVTTKKVSSEFTK